MKRRQIAGTPYVAPFKSWVQEKSDQVYVTDADGTHLVILNTHTQRPNTDLEGLAQEKREAEAMAKFMVRALNTQALLALKP